MRLFVTWAMVLMIQATAFATAAPKVAVLGGEKSSWNDLLVANLGENSAVTLVDRQHLGAVFDEKAIEKLFGNCTDLGRLGNIAGADFLVLLAIKDENVRLVVCDSHLGVTLQDLTLPTKGKDPEKIVAALADQTLKSVRQFKNGVKHLVAVPDFVSRDLTFEHSFLQSDYAEILRTAYRQTPGLAIVAVNEARAIAAERVVGGIDQKDRPVPIFIEGEYRTTYHPKDSSTTVEITVRARNAAKVLLEKKLPVVSLDQAGKQLMKLFGDELAKLTKTGGTKIDIDKQYRFLTERAEEFSAIGEFRRSAALREAALLIKPEADEQRVQLIREYTRRNCKPVEFGDWPKDAKQDPEDPRWMAVVTQVIQDWKRSLQHCEYLIRNRRVSRELGTDLSIKVMRSITGINKVYCKPLDECEAIKKKYVRQVFLRIIFLDHMTGEERRKYLSLACDTYHSLFDIALTRCDGRKVTTDDLDLIVDLLFNDLPDSMEPVYRLNDFLRHACEVMHWRKYRHNFTEKQYLAFLDRLITSKRPVVRIYGRFGKFCYRRYTYKEKSPELLEEMKAIVSEAKKTVPALYRDTTFIGAMQREVKSLDRILEYRKNKKSISRQTSAEPAPKGTMRVSMKPIPLTIVGGKHNGQVITQKLLEQSKYKVYVRRCRSMGDGLDVLWAPNWKQNVVLFMREPGKVVPVLEGEDLNVKDVIGDGRYVWVSADNEHGLTILSRDGKKLARVAKKEGLPPYDTDVIMHPLSPGRILAAGSFGTEHRAWIAMIKFDGTKSKVEVIHEATKVWEHNESWINNVDPHKTFSPRGMCEHVIPGPKPRRIVFVLGRRGPLMIDPETKKVRVYRSDRHHHFPRRHPPSDAFLSIDGVLWIAGSRYDFNSYRFDEQTDRFQVIRDKPSWDGDSPYGTLARDGDWLYYSGRKWRRLNLRTGKEELLAEDHNKIPHNGCSGAWQNIHSSHYGLVICQDGALCRILIDGKTPASKP